jgi:glucosamine 6-phosphate synthetase-like amidotransferase/phosphosugar isomerase protein
MTEIPPRASEVLNHDERIREIAVEIAEARDVLYLGGGSAFPLALEGALKLKGNLIDPRRRLCRRRDEARPDRPH